MTRRQTRERQHARQMRQMRRCGVLAADAAFLLMQARRVGKRLVELGHAIDKKVRS